MISRSYAFTIALALVVIVTLAVSVRAHGGDRQQLAAGDVIRHEFGSGWLAGCFLAIADRETGHTFNPRTSNWTDHHSDGSVGSWGLTQIGSLWRRPGETVEHFRLRMYIPAENLRLAHWIYNRYGLAPWGAGTCQ